MFENYSSIIFVTILFFVIPQTIIIIAYGKILQKAEEKGWKILIPFYNLYLICRICGLNGMYCLLFFVPVVRCFMHMCVSIAIADAFDKTPLFGYGIMLLPCVFLSVLAFSDARYKPCCKANYSNEY